MSLLCPYPAMYGAVITLIFHLNANLVIIVLGAGDLVITNAAFQHFVKLVAKSSLRFLLAGYALVGLPVIALGFWGVYARCLKPVRLYLDYLRLGALLDAVYGVDLLLRFLPCQAPEVVVSEVANANCSAEIWSIALVSVVLILGLKLLMMRSFLSFRDDLDQECEESAQRRLLRGITGTINSAEAEERWRALRDGPLAKIDGLRVPPEYGAAYKGAPFPGFEKNAYEPYIKPSSLNWV